MFSKMSCTTDYLLYAGVFWTGLGDRRRPPGRPRTTWLKTIQRDLKSSNLSLNEAINVAQNHPLWRLMSTFGATHSNALLVVHARNGVCLSLLPAFVTLMSAIIKLTSN